MLAINPLEPFGVTINGDIVPPLSEADTEALRDAIDRHGFAVVRGHPFDEAQQFELLSHLGRVERSSEGGYLRFRVSNIGPSAARDGELLFHYDQVFSSEPVKILSFVAEDIERGATPTEYVDSASVLDRLDPELVERLGQLHGLHVFQLDPTEPTESRLSRRQTALDGTKVDLSFGPPTWQAMHPLIWPNDAGVPCLYACDQHTDQIIELPFDEGDELLRDLLDEMYRPDHVYSHQWEQDDLVIWDNRRIQHRRPEPTSQRRVLRRLQTSDHDVTEQYTKAGKAYRSEHGFYGTPSSRRLMHSGS